MMRFETQNSTYEVDLVGKRIRRLSGSARPTARQGPDGVWKPYVHLNRILGCCLIDWDGEGHSTMTSRVVSEGDVSPTTGKPREAVS